MTVLPKIDVHVHAASVRQPTGRPNPRDPLDCYIAGPAELRAHLQAQGIGRAVLLSGGEHAGDGAPVTTNGVCREIAATQPDFYAWMCNFDPVSPETL